MVTPFLCNTKFRFDNLYFIFCYSSKNHKAAIMLTIAALWHINYLPPSRSFFRG